MYVTLHSCYFTMMVQSLINTLTAADGRSRLCVFGRDDSFFQYRIDRLVDDDDECDPYWREGYPLSGLFASADEARIAGEREFRTFNRSA